LQIARDAIDGRDSQIDAQRALRQNLDQLMEDPGARDLTRPNALALLRAICEGLKPSTFKPVGKASTGETIVVDHSAIALLIELIDALSDLDSGKTDSIFKAYSDGPNSSLTTKQRKWDDAILDAVVIIQRAKGFSTRTKAEKFLAKNLNADGKTRRGKPYTPGMLKRLRDDSKKRNRQKRQK
jgi:hypothetical protein